MHKRQGLGRANQPGGKASICTGGQDPAEATEMPRAGATQDSSNYEAFRKNPFTLPSSMQTRCQASSSARTGGWEGSKCLSSGWGIKGTASQSVTMMSKAEEGPAFEKPVTTF